MSTSANFRRTLISKSFSFSTRILGEFDWTSGASGFKRGGGAHTGNLDGGRIGA